MRKFMLVLAALLVLGGAGCSVSYNEDKETAPASKKESKDNSSKEGDSLVAGSVNGISKKTSSTNDPEAEAKMDTKKVGTPEYGYVNVPSDWANFVDVDGNNSFQVCSIDKSTIISLNIMQGEESAGLEDYASSIAYRMEQDGGKELQAARVKIKNIDAVQVYGKYDDGNYILVTWVFEAEDGKVHYIAAEGTRDKILDAVGYIENGGWSAN